MTSEPQPFVTDGLLVIRKERRGDAQAICIGGELDLANSETAEREVTAALEGQPGPVIVDLSRLEFIDSTGIALIVSLLGRPENAGRLSFVPASAAAVNRVLDLTGLSERLPQAGDGSAATGA
ncbi:MAG TPA: STAS domain-containing protein [Solirubrobacterales bacterium]